MSYNMPFVIIAYEKEDEPTKVSPPHTSRNKGAVVVHVYDAGFAHGAVVCVRRFGALTRNAKPVVSVGALGHVSPHSSPFQAPDQVRVRIPSTSTRKYGHRVIEECVHGKPQS
eukprot:928432-Pyramimonas_sp.AAC.1